MLCVKVTLLGVYANPKKSMWAVQHLPEIWHMWSYCWWLTMVWISSWGLDPFLLNQLCRFQAFYHVASTSEQHTRVTDSSEHQSHSCHFVDLLLLLRTTCGSNFILGSRSYPTDAVQFQAFYCIASTSEQRKMDSKCYKTGSDMFAILCI